MAVLVGEFGTDDVNVERALIMIGGDERNDGRSSSGIRGRWGPQRLRGIDGGVEGGGLVGDGWSGVEGGCGRRRDRRRRGTADRGPGRVALVLVDGLRNRWERLRQRGSGNTAGIGAGGSGSGRICEDRDLTDRPANGELGRHRRGLREVVFGPPRYELEAQVSVGASSAGGTGTSNDSCDRQSYTHTNENLVGHSEM